MNKDINEVTLCGIVGDDMKYGRAVNGREYCTFSLSVVPYNKKHGDNDNESTRAINYIRIVCFNHKTTKQVDYLRSINFHRGQRVKLFGWLSSRKTEIKGVNIIQLSVVVRKIEVVQNKKIDANEKEKKSVFIATN